MFSDVVICYYLRVMKFCSEVFNCYSRTYLLGGLLPTPYDFRMLGVRFCVSFLMMLCCLRKWTHRDGDNCMEPVLRTTCKSDSCKRGIECLFAHSHEELAGTFSLGANGNVLVIRDCRPGATGKAPPAKGMPFLKPWMGAPAVVTMIARSRKYPLFIYSWISYILIFRYRAPSMGV